GLDQAGWSARASAQNSAIDNSSARAVGATPAVARSGSTGTPNVLRLQRSILRRWPKAAAGARSSGPLSAPARGSRRRARRAPPDARCNFGRRDKGARCDIEQDLRLAQPLDEHREPPIGGAPRRRHQPLGDLALKHQDEAFVIPDAAEPAQEERGRDVVG